MTELKKSPAAGREFPFHSDALRAMTPRKKKHILPPVTHDFQLAGRLQFFERIKGLDALLVA